MQGLIQAQAACISAVEFCHGNFVATLKKAANGFLQLFNKKLLYVGKFNVLKLVHFSLRRESTVSAIPHFALKEQLLTMCLFTVEHKGLTINTLSSETPSQNFTGNLIL